MGISSDLFAIILSILVLNISKILILELISETSWSVLAEKSASLDSNYTSI